MPRQARLDALGALHHIIVRGINKAPIFKDDEDKTRFLFVGTHKEYDSIDAGSI